MFTKIKIKDKQHTCSINIKKKYINIITKGFLKKNYLNYLKFLIILAPDDFK